MSVASRAAGPHGGERLVARRVDEGDRAVVVHDLVRADVLGDATGLTGDDVGVADRVEQRGLAVVDVTHDGDDRRPRLEERVVVFVVVAEHRLQLELGLLAGLDEQHLGAERLGDELDHLVGERLRAGDHLARVEQQAHEVGRGAVELGRELLDRDAARDDDLALGDGRVARRELEASTPDRGPRSRDDDASCAAAADPAGRAGHDHRDHRDRRRDHRDRRPDHPDRRRDHRGRRRPGAEAAATTTGPPPDRNRRHHHRRRHAGPPGPPPCRSRLGPGRWPGATRGAGRRRDAPTAPGGGGIGLPVTLRGGAAEPPVAGAARLPAGATAGGGRWLLPDATTPAAAAGPLDLGRPRRSGRGRPVRAHDRGRSRRRGTGAGAGAGRARPDGGAARARRGRRSPPVERTTRCAGALRARVGRQPVRAAGDGTAVGGGLRDRPGSGAGVGAGARTRAAACGPARLGPGFGGSGSSTIGSRRSPSVSASRRTRSATGRRCSTSGSSRRSSGSRRARALPGSRRRALERARRP